MNRLSRCALLIAILMISGLSVLGCGSLIKDQETAEAEDEIMESISHTMNDTPLRFSESKEPIDYFRPTCNEGGVLQCKVKEVSVKAVHIESDTGKMRVRVVFESCLPSEVGETDIFNVDLRIKREDDVWRIAAVNPEQ